MCRNDPSRILMILTTAIRVKNIYNPNIIAMMFVGKFIIRILGNNSSRAYRVGTTLSTRYINSCRI
jgi:hypothetical protein